MFATGVIAFIMSLLLSGESSKANIQETMQDIVTVGLAPSMFMAMIFIRVPRILEPERSMVMSWTWVVRAFSSFGVVVGTLLGWTYGMTPKVSAMDILAHIHIAICGCVLIVISGTMISYRTSKDSFNNFYKTVDDGKRDMSEASVFVGYIQATSLTLLAVIVICAPVEALVSLGYKADPSIKSLWTIYMLAVAAALALCRPPELVNRGYEVAQRNFFHALELYLVMCCAMMAVHVIFDDRRWIGYAAIAVAIMYTKRKTAISLKRGKSA